MLAEEHLRQGHPDEALRLLQEEIKKKPDDVRLRLFLFQLLAIQGEWDRAVKQLKVVGGLDARNLLLAQIYREAIRCELLRQEIFAGRHTPLIFGEPTQWIALLIEALRITASGNYLQGQELHHQAFDLAPPSSGKINGNMVNWIADGDSRLGPVLEAILDGRYYWIAYQWILRIELEPPTDLRDLIWSQARFTWRNGGEAVGLIPVRYPNSGEKIDPALRLARRTEWHEPYPNYFLGIGQRLLLSDVDEYSLLDIREILFDSE